MQNFQNFKLGRHYTWMTGELEMKISQMQPLRKKHKLLPHMKIIACQVCERIFITMNEVKETYSRPVNYFQRWQVP